MSKEAEQPKIEFCAGRSFGTWTQREQENLVAMGLDEGGLVLFKVVHPDEKGDLISHHRCFHGCSDVVWRVREETFEPHSLPYAIASEGLHAASFYFLEDSWLSHFRYSDTSSQALLLHMKPEHFLAVGSNQVKASRYLVLDSMDLSTQKSELFRRLIFDNRRNFDALQLIGKRARSWDDVNRILSTS